MARAAIISVDGHVKAPRAGYRDYIDPKWRDAFDEWLRELDGTPDGFVRPRSARPRQWDPKRRIADLETQGVVAEVLFANGAPFAAGRVDYAPDPAQTRQANMAFNRWVIDFCSEAPGRLHGQALVSFDDVDQAVARRPLGEGAGPRRHPDAAAVPGLEVLLRPGARPDLGRVPGRRPAAQPARRHRCARLPAPGLRRVHGARRRALVLLRSVAVAAHPRRRVRPVPGPEARVRRDRGVVDRADDGAPRPARAHG